MLSYIKVSLLAVVAWVSQKKRHAFPQTVQDVNQENADLKQAMLKAKHTSGSQRAGGPVNPLRPAPCCRNASIRCRNSDCAAACKPEAAPVRAASFSPTAGRTGLVEKAPEGPVGGMGPSQGAAGGSPGPGFGK